MAIGLLTAGASATDENGSFAQDVADTVNASVYTATPPASLTLLPTELSGLVAIKQAGGVTCNIKPNDLFNVAAITSTYYVDINRVDNSGAGTSWATAKKSIRAAIDVANASGQPSKIAVRSGVYAFANSFNPTGVGVTTNVPLYIYGVYGRVLTGTFTEITAFTKTVGQDYVYEAARANCNNVYNPQNGLFYKGVSSIALCNAEAGTFFTDNVTLYVHTHTSSPATSKTVLSCLNSNGCIFIGDNDVMIKGVDFVGGTSGITFSSGITNACILDDVTVKGAVGGLYSARTAQNGVTVIGCGIFAAFNSEASYNSKDGFALNASGGGVKPFGFAVNSSAYENGKMLPTAVSCNGWTLHDGCHGADIGCKWIGSVGTNSGHVLPGTTVWSFGSVAGVSEGDVINGGLITWGAFGAWQGASVIYLDSCMDTGSDIGIYADGGGTAYIRNHSGTGRRIGNVLTY